MGKFPHWYPKGCPTEGDEVAETLYHGCVTNPATAEDFTPFAASADRRKQNMAKSNPCMGSGLSVWRSAGDALHAQELFDYAARWFIFKGDVVESDGKLAPTPTRDQPAHHTFWAYEGVDLRAKFSPALPPMVRP